MLEFLKHLKDLKKAEIWAVLIIIFADLSIAFSGLTILEKIGLAQYFLLLGFLLACTLPICLRLLRLYEARLGIDDMHEAARNTARSQELLNELQHVGLRQIEAAEKLTTKLSQLTRRPLEAPLDESEIG